MSVSESIQQFLAEWESEVPTLTVQTSGSTGKPKRICVEKRRMRTSAQMTCRFLGLQKGQTALLCMPLQYIAGQMMVIRAIEQKLRLIATEPDGHPLADIVDSIDFAAMVPMQVWNSLRVPIERKRLQRIGHLIIGGGAISAELEQELQRMPNAVWSTYGMTETLSHIALRRISGPDATLWYTPLPGIRLSQDASTQTLIIHAPALNPERLHTRDIVEFDTAGRFRILGRTDNTISSGGIKIQLEEVEALLHRHFGPELLATARPDGKFGEALVLLTTRPIDSQQLTAVLKDHPYWRPKDILLVPRLPLTGTGKPDRAAARVMAQV